MRVLTIISTVFIPLTFVVGVYGMNFDPDSSPWNMPELRWYWGYPAVMLAMLLAGLTLLYFFRRRGWLGRLRAPVVQEGAKVVAQDRHRREWAADFR
jgi:magnesium transporter